MDGTTYTNETSPGDIPAAQVSRKSDLGKTVHLP